MPCPPSLAPVPDPVQARMWMSQLTHDQLAFSRGHVADEVAHPHEQNGPEKSEREGEDGRDGEWNEWIDSSDGCWEKRCEVERWYVSGARVGGHPKVSLSASQLRRSGRTRRGRLTEVSSRNEVALQYDRGFRLSHRRNAKPRQVYISPLQIAPRPSRPGVPPRRVE